MGEQSDEKRPAAPRCAAPWTFDPRGMGEPMVAYSQLKENSVDDAVATTTMEARRSEAVRARNTLRKAQSLATSRQTLDSNQQALVLRFHSGELERDTIKNNQAYGYGEGVKRASMERASLFQVSCNQLDRYFETSA